MKRGYLGWMFIVVLGIWGCGPDPSMPEADGKVRRSDLVNVFLGTSGDHGQISPSADTPFNLISIGPVTDPRTHTGYDYYAKKYLGFVHTHVEGVGCEGSGGNILIKPLDQNGQATRLERTYQKGHPGYYEVGFTNGIKARFTVAPNYGMHEYTFKEKEKSLWVDPTYTFLDRFVAGDFQVKDSVVSGWVDSKTTCNAGTYRLYYHMVFSGAGAIEPQDDGKFKVGGRPDASVMTVRIGFSTVNGEYAEKRIQEAGFDAVRQTATAAWDSLFDRVHVKGEPDREALFYSLLYRGLQAPYRISEDDGTYNAADSTVQKADFPVYHGWAVWDNYREVMPMLSLCYPERYDGVARSIANLYVYGKKEWPEGYEPAPTVRAEHTLVVMQDAVAKGHQLPIAQIKDSILSETERLDFEFPNDELESAYDLWAASKLMAKIGDTATARSLMQRSMDYKKVWKNVFADVSKPDADRMGARNLYQGTIWQYRWLVPYDVQGLEALIGGEDAFTAQLDEFFEGDFYNHANQPDIQVPGLYNATHQPWKSQALYRHIMLDTVVQYYFNNNSKGVDPYIGRIYNNRPRAYLRTMDDDMGTMSSWFVNRSMGLSAANVGDPVYYLTAPIFETVELRWENGKTFTINVPNYNKDWFYVRAARLNGKPLDRNWLTHDEIMDGGTLEIETDSVPNPKWGTDKLWVSHAGLE